MNRNDFLKKLATTMGVATVTPMALMANNEPVEKGKTSIAIDAESISHLTMGGTKLKPAEVIRLWQEAGILIYSSRYGNCPTLFNGTVELVDLDRKDYE